MTDEQVLAATKRLAPEPADRWLAYARTAEGSQVIISTGQKYRYTKDALRAAHERAHVGALHPTPPSPPADAPDDIIQRTRKPVEAPSETHRASEPFSDSAPDQPPPALQPNGKKRPRRQSK